MPRRYKKNTRRNRKNTRRNRKNTRRNRKGGNGDKVNCCMCGKEINVKEGHIPLACLNKNFVKAHRICQDCWWDEDTGFAREGADHSCPGCRKNLPLTKITNNEPKIIDLTED